MKHIALPLLLTIFGFFSSVEVQADESIAIDRVTPKGSAVDSLRQIVIEFREPVVPLGRMDRRAEDLPIRIEPPLACQWRWISTKALACQLGEKDAMKRASEYVLRIDPQWGLFDGKRPESVVEHRFQTTTARVMNTWFQTWEAAGVPRFYVSFDQSVDVESVRRHLYFQTDSGSRYAARVEPSRDDTTPSFEVVPAEDLPLATKASLRIEPGLRSLEGPLKSDAELTLESFSTLPAFRFLGVSCFSLDQELLFLSVNESSGAKCDPLNRIALAFSAPIRKEAVESTLEIQPSLRPKNSEIQPWAEVYSYSQRHQLYPDDGRFLLSLPYGLKARAEYSLSASAGSIVDEFERPLANAIDFTFATDARGPRLHVEHTFSTLEKEVDTHIPLIVNNIDAVDFSYTSQTLRETTSNQNLRLRPYQVQDVAYAYPLKIRDILKGDSGIVSGILQTTPPTKLYNATIFSQVTPFSVHVKLGHFNSVAWVTRFADGTPVAGATVHIEQGVFSHLQEKKRILATAVTNDQGIAQLPGLEHIDPELKFAEQWDSSKPQLAVRVQTDEDLALVPANYQYQIYPGLWVNQRPKFGHLRTWGTTAQGIYRAGDTIEYKIYVRNQDTTFLVPAPKDSYELRIVDPLNKVVHKESAISLSPFGAIDGTFTIPTQAVMGYYRFELHPSFTKQQWEPLRVLVTDFTPAPFKVETTIKAERAQQAQPISVETSARLHAGGPYASAPARVVASIVPSVLRAKEPSLSKFRFDNAAELESWISSEHVHETTQPLSDQGESVREILPNAQRLVFGNLVVESSVRDDRGKQVASTSSVPFYGRSHFVGLSLDSWLVTQGKSYVVEALVISDLRQPTRGVPIEIRAERQELVTARVKSAGNAYENLYEERWIEDGSCSLRSKVRGSACTLTPSQPGSYRITASIVDSEGRTHQTRLYTWALGAGRVLWKDTASTLLKISPEKEEYRAGETARLFIQNPYPGARALITVERYGVLRQWVEQLDNSAQVIEVPLKAEDVPGVYVGVVLSSPRIPSTAAEDTQSLNRGFDLDLAKPAVRVGYVRIDLKEPKNTLTVQANTDKEQYQPGEMVRLRLAVKQSPVPQQSESVEIAVSVLDQAVLDLLQAGSAAFDPYRGMYTLEALDVRNFNLLKTLIGKQRFEKKGANQGGDGGADEQLRSLFKYVAYWNPSIPSTNDGQVEVAFRAPDTLTSWRVLAMVANKDRRFGLGEHSFVVNKPIELRSALPNFLTEGDSSIARFTVMNRSQSTKNIRVAIEVSGAVAGDQTLEKEETLAVAPFERALVELPIRTSGSGELVFKVRASAGTDSDALEARLAVDTPKSLETVATFGSNTELPIIERISIPSDIRKDVGGLQVRVSPSVLGDFEKVFEYMKEYPYGCWEQRITKGVFAALFTRLKPYLPESFVWDESDKVIADTLRDFASYQAPSGGMSYFQARDEYACPYLSAYTAQALQWLKELGVSVPQKEQEALHGYLGKLLRENAFPNYYDQQMRVAVRSTIVAALAADGSITADEALRLADQIPLMNLFAKSRYVLALLQFDDTASQTVLLRLIDEILSAADESSGKLQFVEPSQMLYERLLDSETRSQCAVLSSLLAYARSGSDEESAIASRLPKLAQAIGRSRNAQERWLNTQENMYCLNALAAYADSFEKQAVSLNLQASIRDTGIGEGRFSSVRDKALEFQTSFSDEPLKSAASPMNVQLTGSGTGRIYYTARMSFSPLTPQRESVNAGIEVRREYFRQNEKGWELIAEPIQIKRGDLIRVQLYVSIPAPRHFVVVSDPLPAGLEPVNRELATSSSIDAQRAESNFPETSFYHQRQDWIEFGDFYRGFYHREMGHRAVRFYSEYLQAGNYVLSYAAQAIAAGAFRSLPLHAEEMYDPEVFGKSTETQFVVD